VTPNDLSTKPGQPHIGPIREREGHQTNVKARPARLTLLSPELEGLLPTELQPAFEDTAPTAPATSGAQPRWRSSCSVQLFCPAAAPVSEVLAMGDQALMQVAGEQGDAVGSGVVPKEMAGHADLAATAGAEHVLIKPGPVLDRINAGGLQTGEGDRHRGDSYRHTSVLAG